jgi:hypothetical protein
MFNEINTPYEWEKEFYEKNNIPRWELKTHESKCLGKIYETENGSYVEATITPVSAQTWKFRIYSKDSESFYYITTGTGELEKYWESLKLLADDMMVISIDKMLEDV